MTTTSDPTGELDARFSNPEAQPTPWATTARTLADAELYWLTTVRADGRPHVTPLVGAMDDGAICICTGGEEQKARNLAHSTAVALTTGTNTWAKGLDVVVEGNAVRVHDGAALQRIADAFDAKYGSDWHFDVVEDGFASTGSGGGLVAVFRVEPAKVLAFAKDPHAQTRYRFGGSERA